MNNTLAGTEAWFDFYIQPYVDERTTPIEEFKGGMDRTIQTQHVAKIIIPMQDFSVAQGHSENLSFSPWHCLPEHNRWVW